MRIIVALALAGCFTAGTHAERPRALAYNALCILGGAAAAGLGVEILRAAYDSDGLGPFVGGVLGTGGIVGGAYLVVGGLAGIALTELGYVPMHGSP